VLRYIAETHGDSKFVRHYSVFWDADSQGDPPLDVSHSGNLTRLVRAYHDPGYNDTHDFDAVGLNCKFSNLQDVWFHKAELVCSMVFFGSYAQRTFFNHARVHPNETLVVQVNAKHLKLKNGDVPEPLYLILDLGVQGHSGNNSFAAYPTNKMPFDLYIGAWKVISNGSATRRVPLLFELTYGFNPMFSVAPTLHAPITLRDTMLLIRGQLYIDSLIVGLLDVLQTVMWVLAVATLFASFVWVWSPSTRQHHPLGEGRGAVDLLAFSGALLFALPQMRLLWPLAPPSGTRFDILHIYGQLACVSLAIVVQLIRRVMYDWPSQ
jgi:hypothetical protein